MKFGYIVAGLLFCHLTSVGQDFLKINSNNGLSKITYLLSNSFEEDKIDLVLSSASLGVEEYRMDKSTIYIEYEETPPFLTIRCKTGTCIERINHSEAIRKQAFPILLTNSELENAAIISNLNELLNDTSAKSTDIIDRKPTSATSISLRKMEAGTFGIDVELNDVITEEFILDSGASLISINASVFDELTEQGTIQEFDYLDVIYSRIADGSTVENFLFNIKKVTIGKYQFKNVKCVVSPNPDAPLLLGQNILRAFGKISIDYEKNKLHIFD